MLVGMSVLAILMLLAAGAAQGAEDGEWPTYGRDQGGTRYSPLKQINRENVTALRVAWTYHTHAPRAAQ